MGGVYDFHSIFIKLKLASRMILNKKKQKKRKPDTHPSPGTILKALARKKNTATLHFFSLEVGVGIPGIQNDEQSGITSSASSE